METPTRKIIDIQSSIERVEALKTLSRLLLQEVETLAETYIPNRYLSDETNTNLEEKLQRYEINLICHALLEAKGNQRRAAKMLGTKPTTLHAKIRRYEIDLFPVFGHFAD